MAKPNPALKVSEGEHQRHNLSSGSDQLVHLRGPFLSARRVDGAEKGAVVDEVVGCLRRVREEVILLGEQAEEDGFEEALC